MKSSDRLATTTVVGVLVAYQSAQVHRHDTVLFVVDTYIFTSLAMIGIALVSLLLQVLFFLTRKPASRVLAWYSRVVLDRLP